MEHTYTVHTAKRWDAGEGSCGLLIVGLRRQLAPLRPGESLEVVARSAGALHDLEAWCRITGHSLVSAAHPSYVVQKKTS